MSDIDNILSAYDYDFPEELIAKVPASPRDAARLMVFDRNTGSMEESFFSDIVGFIPERSVIVFNRTKVIPARFSIRKTSGGSAKLLYVGIEDDLVKVMSDRKLDIGTVVSAASDIDIIVERQDGKYFFIRFPENFFIDGKFSVAMFHSFLFKNGETPLPPYIKNTPLEESELREEYQSVFAEEEGSVAAPTASLHFTEELIGKIKEAGHEICFITLHVGLGTFAPLSAENISSGTLHEEWYEIPEDALAVINRAREEGRSVIAVGTTSIRTLESAADDKGKIIKASGFTNLFIREGYRFKVVKGIITNFHVPRSSLLMLVSAFAGRDNVVRLYKKAITDGFRLFSFGDGMIII
ncbi:MAG: tRNA preQ1(34) S-adenosylmethionine ribosyltransferase-isomerase QueA [Candidatus Colwellbacteria bacterium]|nr:tRNA preQ1(34) S-adenosylmethionine ribosyltransferase-isomerase QueA [Candidatus Colwellbacteria bacterium]